MLASVTKHTCTHTQTQTTGRGKEEERVRNTIKLIFDAVFKNYVFIFGDHNLIFSSFVFPFQTFTYIPLCSISININDIYFFNVHTCVFDKYKRGEIKSLVLGLYTVYHKISHAVKS